MTAAQTMVTKRGVLLAEDLAMFAKIGVEVELLERARLCRVTDIESRELYGIELKHFQRADLSGIVFEYRHPTTGQRVSARLRRDNPEHKPDGRPENKYLLPHGDNRHLYFPPGVGELLKDVSVPVVFVESEKAVLAVMAWTKRQGVSLLAVGTGGCTGWQGKTGIRTGSDGTREPDLGPLPDFGLMAWEGREVIICFDSNARTNQMVQRQRGKLAQFLTGLKARAKIATVPSLVGVNGPDDLIGLHGDEAFGRVISDVEPFDFQKHLPQFFVDVKGSWAVEYGSDGKAKYIWIASPLHIVAYTRDEHGNNWGRLLRWEDAERRPHIWSMPMELLGGDGIEVYRRLLGEGVRLATGRKDRGRLLDYLQDSLPTRAVKSVSRLGWHTGTFILPDVAIGTEAEKVIYQPPREQEHHYRVSCSVEDWRSNVGRYCPGNSRLVFAASAGFAGPLLDITGEESGGFHLRGSSSTGKSTALLVAGSVWGGGTNKGFVETWRATLNGLEAIAELHNHGLLCLDELGQVDPREAGETAYLLANGAGKSRMTKSVGARRKLTWTLLVLSSGEISLADHVRTVGKRTRAGQEVRLIDLAADAQAGLGLFEELHGTASPDQFSRLLAENAKKFYGAPVRAFLKFVCECRADIEKAVSQYKAAFLKQHVPPEAVGEISRAAGRFALVGAAGELATDAGITGWVEGESNSAATRLFREWISGRTMKAGDEEAAIRQVRAVIEAHGGSRFERVQRGTNGIWQRSSERITNRLGFRLEGDVTEYFILSQVFRSEVCAGFDPKITAQALANRGYLETQNDEYTVRRVLPEVGRPWGYLVRSSILDANLVG